MNTKLWGRGISPQTNLTSGPANGGHATRGYKFDGNKNSRPDGDADTLELTLSSALFGDLNIDGVLGVSDVVQFVGNWNSDAPDLAYEMGPTVGVPPFTSFIPDQKFNYEDLLAFIATWKWNHNQGSLAKRSTTAIQTKIPDLITGDLSHTITPDARIDYQYMFFDTTNTFELIEYQILEGSDIDTVFSPYLTERYEQVIHLSGVDSELLFGLGLRECTMVSSVLVVKGAARELTKNKIFIRTWSEEGLVKWEGVREFTVDPDELLPHELRLFQNFPNPFNGSTKIHYELPENSRISLLIYDIRGRLIKTLVNEEQTIGFYTYDWDGLTDLGTPAASGMYFCRLQTENSSQLIKMAYLK
jgi:hypothetical protein